ncbi:hypothetical protein ACA910_021382 [Epithemia clementina (nom. ined.)]
MGTTPSRDGNDASTSTGGVDEQQKNRKKENDDNPPKAGTETTVVCENCAKTTQRDVPEHSPIVQNHVCQDSYNQVDQCMKSNNGQVSKCVMEWQAFRTCHDTKVATVRR